MDTIITAVVGAMANLGVQIVKSSYEKLKTKIREKFGDENEVKKAMDELEKNSASHASVEVLKQEVASKGLQNDAEISVLAKELLEVLHEQNPGDKMTVNQEISGNKR